MPDLVALRAGGLAPGRFMIFVTRTRIPFWSSAPAPIMLAVVVGTKVIATLIAVHGIFMTPIGWTLALGVWAYSAAWLVLCDRVKLLLYRFFDARRARLPAEHAVVQVSGVSPAPPLSSLGSNHGVRGMSMMNGTGDQKTHASLQDDGRARRRPPLRSLAKHYLLAIAMSGLATAGRESLAPLFGGRYPFTTFYVAVVVSSWAGGLGPGLCSTFLGGLFALYLWTGPRWSIAAEEPRDLVGLVLFTLAGVAISLVNESLRRSVIRERGAKAEAQAAHAEAEAARARTEAAVLAREEIQAIVAHDLRNPLGVIMMQASLLKRSACLGAEDEQIRRCAERLLRAAERMNALIRDLLDAASIEAGHLAVEPKPDDVSATVREAIEAAESPASAKGIVLERVLPDEAVVRWDRERMLQVLGNLLGNAIKFTPEGGQIRVDVAVDAEHVRISVADTGPGIPPHQLPHIFERFWKGKRSAGAGTGLGLFIASGIVKAHGGTIDVQTEAGAGTTFSMCIPRDADSSSDQGSTQVTPVKSDDRCPS